MIFSGKNVFCTRSDRRVFDDLEFSLSDGDVLILNGPNGSGKSSLLRIMAGLLRPSAGKICRDGADIRDDFETHCQEMRYAGHLDAVKPALTVAENIEFWAALYGHKPDLGRSLSSFNLTHLAHLPGRMLSAGQKHRVNLARLAATPSKLWLLDEPTVALDAASITCLEALIRGHRSAGGIAVLSTHTDLGIDNVKTLSLADFRPDAAI